MIILTILSKIKNFIFKYWKQLLLVGLGAFLTLKVQGCAKKLFPGKTPISGPSSPTTPKLPKGDKEVITVDDTKHTTTITTDKGTTVVNGSRQTTIEIKNNGKVVVHNKTHGLCLNPMLGAGVNNTGAKGILAAEIGYWNKLDVVGGMGADKYLAHTAFFIAPGYTPNTKFFHNTSFFVGPMIDVKGNKGIFLGFAARI